MNARKVSSLRCPPYVLQDCFFASVCTRDSPHLQSVPVAVAHSDTDGSEISAANYAARAFGKLRSCIPLFLSGSVSFLHPGLIHHAHHRCAFRDVDEAGQETVSPTTCRPLPISKV